MHVIVWRFTTSDDAAFERHYGPEGTWVAFFRRSAGYIRTDLLKGSDGYLTLDWWTSLEAYNACRSGHAEEYAEIDHVCESVTTFEERLGEYTQR